MLLIRLNISRISRRQWRGLAMLGAFIGITALLTFACSSDAIDSPNTDAGDGDQFSQEPQETSAIVDAGGKDTNADAPINIHYCDTLTPKPTFCDSFDDSLTLSATNWNLLQNHGTIAIATDNTAPTLPNVAIAGSMQCDAGNSCVGGLEHVFGAAKDIDLSMAVRLDAWDGAQIDIASIAVDINKPSGSGTLLLDVQDGLFVVHSTVLDPTGTSFDHSTSLTTGLKANVNSWYLVGIHMSLGATPPTVTFTVGSTPTTLTLPADYTQADAPNATMHAGITYVTGPSAPAQLRFDNVVATVK